MGSYWDRARVVGFGMDTDVGDTEGYKGHAGEAGGGRGADVVDIAVVDIDVVDTVVVDTDCERGHRREAGGVEDIGD